MSDDPLQRGTPPGSLRYFAVLYAPIAARPLLSALYAFEAEIRDTARARRMKLRIRDCNTGAVKWIGSWQASRGIR